MSTVFVSGSRSITTLDDEARRALDRIMRLGFNFVVGDGYGVDIAVQHYLKSKNYQPVTVYHIGKKPRNNAGYPTRYVPSPFQTQKNVEMAQAADYGLAIWDGRSRETAEAIQRMKEKDIQVRIVRQVSEATTRFCRAGTHPRKPDYHDRPVPEDMPRCSKCFEPRQPEELKAWDGQSPCPPYSVFCLFNQAITG